MKQNGLTHQPQEGSNRKISVIFPLVSCTYGRAIRTSRTIYIKINRLTF